MSMYEPLVTTLNEITLNNIRQYVKTLDIDQYGDDPTSCWNSAMYIRKLFNLATVDVDDNEHTYTTKLIDFEQIYQFDGIYMCMTDCNDEFHYFTIAIKDDKLILYSTYGGLNKFIKKQFNKKEWMENFIDVAKYNDIQKYKYCFGLDKIEAKNVCNFSFTYDKIV